MTEKSASEWRRSGKRGNRGARKQGQSSSKKIGAGGTGIPEKGSEGPPVALGSVGLNATSTKLSPVEEKRRAP